MKYQVEFEVDDEPSVEGYHQIRVTTLGLATQTRHPDEAPLIALDLIHRYLADEKRRGRLDFVAMFMEEDQ